MGWSPSVHIDWSAVGFFSPTRYDDNEIFYTTQIINNMSLVYRIWCELYNNNQWGKMVSLILKMAWAKV